MFQFLPVFLLTILLAACSSKSSDSKTDAPIAPEAPAASCSLEGTWSRCTDNGNGTSGKVTLVVTGSQLAESIEEYNSVGDCNGTADNSFSFNAQVALETIGGSGAYAGATDATLTPDVDLFGCGVNQPAYTIIKFNDSCTEFNSGVGTPACDINNRPTSIDPAVFAKQ